MSAVLSGSREREFTRSRSKHPKTFGYSVPSWLIVNEINQPRKRGELIRWYFSLHHHKLPKATDALPGSVEKVNVLARRVERGEQLFTDGDCTDLEDRRYSGRLFE